MNIARLTLAMMCTGVTGGFLLACSEDEGTPCALDVDCPGVEVCLDGTCGTPGEPECTTDDDCAAGETCDTTAQMCVTATTCTTDEDCAADELCDVASGTCIAGCSVVGAVGDPPCAVADVCLADGTCAAQCDSLAPGCADSGNLCDLDPSSTTFNECVDADLVSRSCARVEDLPSRDFDGPVIVDVLDLGDAPPDPACPGGFVTDFTATFFSEDPVSQNLFTERVRFVNAAGELGNTFSAIEQPSPVDGADNVFDVDFQLCRTSMMETLFAIVITDDEDDASNPFCFEVDAM
ncbi:MAG: hypothetical protein ACFB9M_11275 [Myxococcota bacterium]